MSSQTVVLVLSSLLLLVTRSHSQDLQYTIKEERPSGSKIGNIVNDSTVLDRTISGVEYRILTQGNEFAKYFRIDNRTGDLFTSEVLDRESLTDCEFSDVCTIPLEIIAQAPGGRYFKKVGIQFIIEDINDNAPKFTSNQTTVEISESSATGESLSLEGAVDLDIGINSVLTYRIVPSENVPFVVVDDKSPIIKLQLVQKIDRETTDKYQFQILAIDGGSVPLTGALEVTVLITDNNDNKPKFLQPVFNISIDEDLAVNSVILNISATDPDEGVNGEVSYRLSSHQSEEIRNMFAIDSALGNLTIIKPLTYQPGETLKIIIEASDNAIQPLISQAIVYVKVLDSTNDVPEIHVNLLSSSSRASIAENATIGAAVAHVKVTDDDLGTNGYVNCSVTRGHEFFGLEKLDVNEYKVVVSAKLDREKKAFHDVTVTCQDFGVPSLNASENFEVEILDINEEPPKFVKSTFEVSLTENNNIGALLTTVSAIDTDSGVNARIRYSLLQTGKYNFVIDSVTGEIRVNFVLDREAVPEITFKVAASDSGVQPKTGLATVIVIILDDNDNDPRFENQPITLSVLENQPIDTFVGKVKATDIDARENGTVKYKMKDQLSTFWISENGSIFTKDIIDRELYPHGITLSVIAYDQCQIISRNASAFVTVLVTDINDNAPILVFPNEVNRTITMIYDLPEGTIIGRVEAEDKDYSINAKLTYSFSEKSAHLLFRIDGDTGEIKTARSFTTQDINRYVFTITVEDQGVPKYSVNHTLIVAIISNIYEPIPRFKEEGGDSYLLIAVVISCVTVVLAGVIILVIFLLRRIDQKKREHENATHQEQLANSQKSGLYDALDVSRDPPKTKSEKRVSFSDSLESTDTPIERPSFKMTPSKEKIEQLLDQISTPPTARESQVRSLGLRSPGRQNPRSQLDKMKLQKELLQLHNSRMASMVRMQDDNESETSIESNTSDSGRGGSESDIHSTLGQIHVPEIDVSRRQFQPESDVHHRTRPSNTAIQLQDMQPKFPHSSHQHSEYKVPRTGDYRTLPKPVDYENVPKSISFNSQNGTIDYNSVSKPLEFSNLQIPKTSVTMGANLRPYHYFNFKNSLDNFQRHSISDVVSESVATYDEYDNASTTTSGSYTVDDLDADFRSDVIV